ncbi:MAG: tetratricopeptide repeat protein [Bacteroidetes bacterium]|uniref:Tetratricopeptide repeat protein n=1 Tax=Candidatus Pullibacteroides excrementavium TaxID=2840905 RepID=A0A9D9DRS8_9BACT|nr:tetratricopeptide repeat protein [Candidatus Pullibacteroides excrementavium]
MRKSFFSVLAVSMLLLATGCSTKKNTFLNRNFHNLTSYYNVYWNGKETLLDADYLLQEQSVDNYFNVIPVFKYGNPEDTALVAEQARRMMEKALITIKKHSISIRGKEYVKTIDDAYILLGKGLFYKQDYSKARSVFNFVLSEYPKNPERFEAMLWIARTYMREEEYGMALSFVSQVDAQPQQALLKETYRDLPLVQAQLCIQQEKYKEAIPYLQQGLQRAKKADVKSRIIFILGQIAQNEGDKARAVNYYRECLKLNPPLDLVFNARLNIVLCSEGNSVAMHDVLKDLQKMLRDPKNSAYFGRIYYVMGEMAFRQGREEEAVRYMDQSIAASQGDPARTLLAAKRLSAYFYGKKEYIRSQQYYAAAAEVVEMDDPDYYTIVSRAENLADLTSYYTQLTESDTLRIVGRMDKKDQKKYAERKAKEYQKAQEAARLAREQSGGTDVSTPGRSNWYFYNQQTKNAGLAEFNRLWGRRTLEDLWFLSAKPAAAMLRPPSRNEEEVVEEAPKVITQADPEYYLQDLPTTDSAFARLDSIIEPALYHVGMVYSDQLSENEEGKKYLVRLIEEFPESDYIPSACETLCKIFHQEGDMGSYQKYAAILSTRYAGTIQDQRVNNPDYYKNLEANSQTVESLYTQIYNCFLRNDFQCVLSLVGQVEEEFPINTFQEQLSFLKTMATAHVKGYNEMIPMADNFLKSYPESELKSRMQAAYDRAKADLKENILFPDSDPVLPEDMPVAQSAASIPAEAAETEEPGQESEALAENASPVQDTVPSEPIQVEYVQPKSTEKHYIIAVCDSKERDSEAMLLRLGEFNRRNYSQMGLKTEAVPAGDKYMVVISSFPVLRGAANYLDMVKDDDYVFGTLEFKILFLANEANMELLKEYGDYEGYEAYYKETYGATK